jgi:hypothetical protein
LQSAKAGTDAKRITATRMALAGMNFLLDVTDYSARRKTLQNPECSGRQQASLSFFFTVDIPHRL